ncbi:polymer-forming cytoskeletal protein [Janthinobacterium sp. PAMC25594]|uniref:polymer-forming cytoskeletal protein n=1 Tax=Janthinobacterium sp. PAMC25594 TaxID=2861284 RepID=UPI001C62F625|nr:polymer-forming cytoskeletal protein [Janthinobacterium sp. PAMC25594]QYG04702.1 polymer-forming cytoskeletal protein [Janthinobacterium sp. PAMC25594]
MVIESGYRVTVNSPVTITYNQGLTMRGTATLTAKGDINVSDNPPSRLKISGGSMIANGGTFIAGGQNGQNIVANIIASSIKLGGSPISVTGNLNATGAVTISASSIVNGAIQGGSVSIEADAKVTNGISSTGPINLASRVNVTGAITGTTIVTASAVVIDGSITASTSLLIESASKVTGNLTAPSIQLKSTDLVVTGNVKASQTLVIENKATIKGDIEGGNVTLGDSEATITGNALVDHITLGYHGWVQQTITCKAYTPSNPCSCVTNNSGWPAGSVNLPKCGPGTPTGPHHFQIDHPGTALTCAPQTVTVTACADAACSAKYTGGANVTVSPGGVATPIDSSGVATASVRQYTVGTATLSLTSVPGTTGALVCKRSSDNSNSCNMAFAATGLMLTPTNHVSATQPSFGISAVQASGDQQACVPLFANKNKDLTLACGYSNPASGTLPVFIKGTGAFIALAADNSSACSALGKSVNLAFDDKGVAKATMSYADVGKVNLKATYTGSSASGDTGLSMTGSADVIVVPDAFSVVAIANPQRAGAPVTVSMSALNSAGAVTPNFGNEKPSETALPTLASLVKPTTIEISKPAKPDIQGGVVFKNGSVASSDLSWPEVGTITIAFKLANPKGYLEANTAVLTLPKPSRVSEEVQFIPHHFITELIKNKDADQPKVTDGIATPCAAPLTCANDGEKGRYAYSGQAIGVRVTARALGGATTANYDERNPSAMAPVLLEGLDAATGTISFPPSTPDGSSRLTDGSKAQTTVTGVAPVKFTLGVASPMVAYRFPGKAGVPVKLAPTDVLLRASSTYPGGTVVSSSSALIQNEARMTVLSGQWQVAHGYGSELLPVRLAVQVQYWNGTKWITNLLDSISAFNKSQVVFVNCKKTLDCSKLAADDLAYTVVQGALPQANRLTLLAPGTGKAGRVDVSVGNHPYLASTVGVVVFGILRSGPVIYLREMY